LSQLIIVNFKQLTPENVKQRFHRNLACKNCIT